MKSILEELWYGNIDPQVDATRDNATRDLPNLLVCVDCSFKGNQKPVYVVLDNSTDIIKRWNCIDDWFASEFERYEKMYTNGAYEIVEIAGGQVRNMYFPEIYK